MWGDGFLRKGGFAFSYILCSDGSCTHGLLLSDKRFW